MEMTTLQEKKPLSTDITESCGRKIQTTNLFGNVISYVNFINFKHKAKQIHKWLQTNHHPIML